MGAAGGGAGQRHRHARRHRGEHRPADAGSRARRGARRPAVDRQRVRPRAGGADPAGRLARRPVRPAPGLRPRHRVVRRRQPAVRARARRRGADRGTGAAGDRRRAADPRQPRAPAGVVRPGRPGPGRGRLVRARRGRRGHRPVRRRAAGRGVVAARLPHQPAAVRDRRRGRPASRPGVLGPAGQPARRRGRRAPGRAGAGRGDVRPGGCRGARGLHRCAGERSGRRGRPGRVRARRTPRRPPDAAAGGVRLPAVQRRQRRHLRRLRRPGRGALPARRAPAGRRRLLAARRRHLVAARHRAHARAVRSCCPLGQAPWPRGSARGCR